MTLRFLESKVPACEGACEGHLTDTGYEIHRPIVTEQINQLNHDCFVCPTIVTLKVNFIINFDAILINPHAVGRDS